MKRDAKRRAEQAKAAAGVRLEVAASEGDSGSEPAGLAVREGSEPDVYAPDITTPPDPTEVGIERRRLLNRVAVAGSGFGLLALGGASVAFLVPPPPKGFGGDITIGTPLDDIKSEIESKQTPFYAAEARSYIELYEASDEALAEETYKILWPAVQETGVMPLFQKCPHLGCRVPWCDSSQWFECPCHGSQYNAAGEKKGGPAPRGMDRFEFELAGDYLVIKTGKLVEGPPEGTDTTGQQAAGPHCVG
ncbi:MAG: Rieske 2Fe-2S domain-containing protein [Acidimicrobiia bacterium]|nr:Rieske 2Fe-2S domain-containing protein [Acidimicrobiia bacterium]